MKMTVSKAIKMSWASLANPAVLSRLLIPIAFAAGFSIAILWKGWPIVTTSLVPYLNTFGFISSLFSYLDQWLGFSLLTVFALFFFIVITFIVTYFFLIILTSIVLVPLLNPIIRKHYFPQLVENAEIGWFDNIRNTLGATFVFFLALIFGSPLFFIPIAQIIYPLFLNSYLAKRIFPYDVLQNYATSSEFERFRLKENNSLWTLSLLTNGYIYVPILNFFAAPLIA